MAVSDQAAGRRRARRGEPIPTAMAKPEPDELDISDTAALPDAGSFSDAPVTKRARAMGVGESPPAHGTAPAGDSNAFEAERAARIAANAARLAELELPGLAAGLAASAPIKRARPAAPSQRGVSARRRSAAADAPPRRSARAAGQAPDAATSGGVLLELRGGRVLLAPPTGSGGGGARAAAAREQQPQQEPPPPPGPLPFTSSNGDAESDEVLLKQLRAQADAAASCEEGRLPTVATGKALLGLSLASSNIAKLTRGPTTQLVVHPSSQRTLIAAADKAGQIAVWDVDAPPGSSCDGVAAFAPHSDYVSSLAWLDGGARLLSSSYDGTVRRLDVCSGIWELLAGPDGPHDGDGWSAAAAAPGGSGDVVHLATAGGALALLDTRAGGFAGRALTIATRKVNTLAAHAGGTLLLSAATSGAVAVWDVRKLAFGAQGPRPGAARAPKPLCEIGHDKSSQAAVWAPDGSSRLASISFDDTLAVWQDSAGAAGASGCWERVLRVSHNNQTGRFVVPFRPVWSPCGGSLLVGDMKRCVVAFDAARGSKLGSLNGEGLTAVPSRLATHPAGLPMIAGATNSGRVHIWR